MSLSDNINISERSKGSYNNSKHAKSSKAHQGHRTQSQQSTCAFHKEDNRGHVCPWSRKRTTKKTNEAVDCNPNSFTANKCHLGCLTCNILQQGSPLLLLQTKCKINQPRSWGGWVNDGIKCHIHAYKCLQITRMSEGVMCRLTTLQPWGYGG